MGAEHGINREAAKRLTDRGPASYILPEPLRLDLASGLDRQKGPVESAGRRLRVGQTPNGWLITYEVVHYQQRGARVPINRGGSETKLTLLIKSGGEQQLGLDRLTTGFDPVTGLPVTAANTREIFSGRGSHGRVKRRLMQAVLADAINELMVSSVWRNGRFKL